MVKERWYSERKNNCQWKFKENSSNSRFYVDSSGEYRNEFKDFVDWTFNPYIYFAFMRAGSVKLSVSSSNFLYKPLNIFDRTRFL